MHCILWTLFVSVAFPLTPSCSLFLSPPPSLPPSSLQGCVSVGCGVTSLLVGPSCVIEWLCFPTSFLSKWNEAGLPGYLQKMRREGLWRPTSVEVCSTVENSRWDVSIESASLPPQVVGASLFSVLRSPVKQVNTGLYSSELQRDAGASCTIWVCFHTFMQASAQYQRTELRKLSLHIIWPTKKNACTRSMHRPTCMGMFQDVGLAVSVVLTQTTYINFMFLFLNSNPPPKRNWSNQSASRSLWCVAETWNELNSGTLPACVVLDGCVAELLRLTCVCVSTQAVLLLQHSYCLSLPIYFPFGSYQYKWCCDFPSAPLKEQHSGR